MAKHANSYFIHPTTTKGTYESISCCQFLSGTDRKYYSFVPDADLEVEPKQFELWVETLKELGYNILSLSRNEENEKIINTSAVIDTLVKVVDPEDMLKGLKKELASSKDNIFVIGNKHASKIYNITNESRAVKVVSSWPEFGRMLVKSDDVTYEVIPHLFNRLREKDGKETQVPLLCTAQQIQTIFKEHSCVIPAFLVHIDARFSAVSCSKHRLLLHTLLRLCWSSQFKGLMSKYFKITKALPDIHPYEALYLASISGYPYSNGIYIDNAEVFMPDVEGIKANITEGRISRINDLFNKAVGYKGKNTCQRSTLTSLVDKGKYKKAYDLAMELSFGKVPAKQVKAKKTYKFITEGGIYEVVSENEKSYKIISDRLEEEWYQKDRFNNA